MLSVGPAVVLIAVRWKQMSGSDFQKLNKLRKSFGVTGSVHFGWIKLFTYDTKKCKNLHTQIQSYIAPTCFGITHATDMGKCLAHEDSTSWIKNQLGQANVFIGKKKLPILCTGLPFHLQGLKSKRRANCLNPENGSSKFLQFCRQTLTEQHGIWSPRTWTFIIPCVKNLNSSSVYAVRK
jgi:hypothetical protein